MSTKDRLKYYKDANPIYDESGNRPTLTDEDVRDLAGSNEKVGNWSINLINAEDALKQNTDLNNGERDAIYAQLTNKKGDRRLLATYKQALQQFLEVADISPIASPHLHQEFQEIFAEKLRQSFKLNTNSI